MADLKVAISTNMSRNYFNKESTQFFETPKFLKKSLSALRDVKFSGSGEGFGISSSAKIFEAVLYSQVKDAIICFDDFERMS
ncbi:KAP family P-loop domain protein, partial [Acinetobacter baumannii]